MLHKSINHYQMQKCQFNQIFCQEEALNKKPLVEYQYRRIALQITLKNGSWRFEKFDKENRKYLRLKSFPSFEEAYDCLVEAAYVK
jgi:hypothetical protein